MDVDAPFARPLAELVRGPRVPSPRGRRRARERPHAMSRSRRAVGRESAFLLEKVTFPLFFISNTYENAFEREEEMTDVRNFARSFRNFVVRAKLT